MTEQGDTYDDGWVDGYNAAILQALNMPRTEFEAIA